MFNPFDEQNHAGLLYGMRSSPLLGLAGPFSARGMAASSGLAELAKALQDPKVAVEALPQVTKEKLAGLCGYKDVAKWQPAFVEYLSKPFDPPGSYTTGSAKLLFAGACEYAQDNPTVIAYFDKLVLALDAKKAAIKAENAAKVEASNAVNQQAILDAANKSASELKGTEGVAAEKLRAQMINFVDWIQRGMQSVIGTEANFPNNMPFTPWMMQQALYGRDPIWNPNPSTNGKKIVMGQPWSAYKPFEAGNLPSWLLQLVAPAMVSSKKLWDNKYNFDYGPALQDLPGIATKPNSKAWLQAEKGKTYVVVPCSGGSWRFAGLGPSVATRLRHNGPSRDVAPGGWCATQAWNLSVVPAAKSLQDVTLKLDEVLLRASAAKQARDVAKAAQDKLLADAANETSKFEKLLANAEKFKVNLGDGFLLGYVDTITKQLLAAVGLNSMTDVRFEVQARIDELHKQAETLVSNANKLITDAKEEKDPVKRQMMRAEAERRLSRATGISLRRLELIGNDRKLGVERLGRAQTIETEAKRGGIVISSGAGAAEGAAKVGGKLGDKLTTITDVIKKNVDAINTLNEHSQKQKQDNQNLNTAIFAASDDLPDSNKPVVPPRDETGGDADAGGLGYLVAGLVALAALTNKN